MSDPACAHLIPRHSTNAPGAYSEWMAQVVTRLNGHFLLVFTQLVARPSQESWQNSKVLSLSWYLPGTYHIGVSAALGARVYSQTPAGVHRAFRNASTEHRIQLLIGTQPD